MIAIDPSGRIEFVFDESLRGLLDLGRFDVFRASHVEPCVSGLGLAWRADMSPVGGPVLGPFDTRDAALASEVAWLEQNYLGRSK